jgi:hypothetical protein
MTANYILNKVPYKKLEKTSYKVWKGKNPYYKYFKVFQYIAKVAVPDLKKVKIGPKNMDYIFIRYTYNSNAYKFLLHKSSFKSINPNTIMESRNATFFEVVFLFKEV